MVCTRLPRLLGDLMHAQIATGFIVEMVLALSLALFSAWAVHAMLAQIPAYTAEMNSEAAVSGNAINASVKLNVPSSMVIR